jgi:hypothetical protein
VLREAEIKRKLEKVKELQEVEKGGAVILYFSTSCNSFTFIQVMAPII